MGLFGGLTRALFGGGKSANRAFGQLQQDFTPWIQQGGQGMGALGNLLGLNGPGQQSDAAKGWWNSSGGDFMLNQGMEDVDAFMRAKGMGNSGAAMKAMEGYRSDLASTKMGEVTDNLARYAGLGLGAGNVIGGAGGKSTQSNGGLGQLLGSFLASDPRLKTAVEKLDELPDGLGIYAYDYLPQDGPIASYMPEGRQIGVMADEVALLRPWALGPVVGGFATVNYGAL